MNLSENMMTGCHGNHFIELGMANLAFLVLLLGKNL